MIYAVKKVSLFYGACIVMCDTESIDLASAIYSRTRALARPGEDTLLTGRETVGAAEVLLQKGSA